MDAPSKNATDFTCFSLFVGGENFWQPKLLDRVNYNLGRLGNQHKSSPFPIDNKQEGAKVHDEKKLFSRCFR